MASPRYRHTASVLGSGAVLVAGGKDPDNHYVAAAELVLPGAEAFSYGGILVTPRYAHTATTLAGSRVLVVAGRGGAQDYPIGDTEVATLSVGDPCVPGDACEGGTCVDGVCCDAPCTGQCEACDITPGKCTPIPAGTPPRGSRAACAPGTQCLGSRDVCVVGAVATCDGDHTTIGIDSRKFDCAPYKCDPDGTCRSSCRSVVDCVAPSVCSGDGKCVAGPMVEGQSCSVSAAHPMSRIDDRRCVLLLAACLSLCLARRGGRRKDENQ